MPLSDIAGLIGSALLLFAPARDQFYRWRIFGIRLRAKNQDALKKYRTLLEKEEERRRNQPTCLDTLTLSLGALGLAISYLL